MPYGFEIFIDEFGDEGFRFRQLPAQGSSEWLILSAVMVPLEAVPQVIETMREVRNLFSRAPTYAPHFVDLNHGQRVAWISRIVQIFRNLRIASVLIHKPTLQKRALFSQKDRLYFYATRYLIERISWFCRDYHKFSPQGDGTAKIIFSQRKGMKYEYLRSYLAILNLASPSPGDEWIAYLRAGINIHWPSIKIDQVEAAPHSSQAGLQMADAVASGLRSALEYGAYGQTEHRFATAFHQITHSVPTKKGRPKELSQLWIEIFPELAKGRSAMPLDRKSLR